MANTITLKQRIASIRNTRQITKAMELVSSSKLRRAQAAALSSRAYREAAYELLGRLSAVSEVEQQPLFKKRSINNRLYVVITSSTGLAGAYNANVLKQLTQGLRRDKEANVKSSVITVGSKGAQFVRRLSGVDLLAYYPSFGDNPTENDIQPILNTLVSGYTEAAIDEVVLIYTMFRSSITQEAVSTRLLPAQIQSMQASGEAIATPTNNSAALMNFEPDVETVIHQVGARLIQAQIWQALLESQASEHAARAIAMKNATDNANDLIEDYTLAFNTARQAAITQELAEISGGAEALNG